MSLEEKFFEFIETQQKQVATKVSKFDKHAIIYAANQFAIKNRSKINTAQTIAKAIKDFKTAKTPFALIETLLDVPRAVASSCIYAQYFFIEKNGWKQLKVDYRIATLLIDVCDRFPTTPVSFQQSYRGGDQGFICTLPNNYEIGFIKSETNAWYNAIYYKFDNDTNDDALAKTIINFLIEEKQKELKTNILHFTAGKDQKTDLVGYTTYPIRSSLSDYYVKTLRRAFELGHRRSWIFNGPPGTGKSTLIQTIVSDLNIRTLIFKASEFYDAEVFMFLIKELHIECVLFDDFDQVMNASSLLGFLDQLSKETKLVIAVVNTLHKFHPAVIRAGRFDEVIKITKMDEEVLSGILGQLSLEYLTKVSEWPICYVNELVIRYELYGKEKLESNYHELAQRVKADLDGMGKIEEAIAAKKEETDKKVV